MVGLINIDLPYDLKEIICLTPLEQRFESPACPSGGWLQTCAHGPGVQQRPSGALGGSVTTVWGFGALSLFEVKNAST